MLELEAMVQLQQQMSNQRADNFFRINNSTITSDQFDPENYQFLSQMPSRQMVQRGEWYARATLERKLTNSKVPELELLQQERCFPEKCSD